MASDDPRNETETSGRSELSPPGSTPDTTRKKKQKKKKPKTKSKKASGSIAAAIEGGDSRPRSLSRSNSQTRTRSSCVEASSPSSSPKRQSRNNKRYSKSPNPKNRTPNSNSNSTPKPDTAAATTNNNGKKKKKTEGTRGTTATSKASTSSRRNPKKQKYFGTGSEDDSKQRQRQQQQPRKSPRPSKKKATTAAISRRDPPSPTNADLEKGFGGCGETTTEAEELDEIVNLQQQREGNEAHQQRRAQPCCCCDSLTGSIITNVIYIIFLSIYLFAATAAREELLVELEGLQKEIGILNQLLIKNSIGIVMALLGIFGALRLHKFLVLATGIWYLVDFVWSLQSIALLGTGKVTVILQTSVLFFLGIANFLAFHSIHKGHITRTNYKTRERFCCCCDKTPATGYPSHAGVAEATTAGV